ncbi:uncharacterized protein [Watersipora subatra]|uniref:uncharacterized protein n=1 Tax=Watersipora subatra TaxID=2589382 RepID=UPI00355C1425
MIKDNDDYFFCYIQLKLLDTLRHTDKESVFGDTLPEVFSTLLGRGQEASRTTIAKSPTGTKSPSGSKVSSRRSSFMFFRAMSTDSALSDGNEDNSPQANVFKSASFRRKFSEKSIASRPNSNPQLYLASLHEEYNKVMMEYTKLKHLVEKVQSEYEETKDYDMVKRYQKLKGVIKRCLTYVRLGILPDTSGAVVSLSNVSQSAAPGTIPNRYSFGAVGEIPKSELLDKTETTKRKISLLRSQIELLSERYEMSKQYMVFPRYRLMKAMVKELTTNAARF